MLRLPQSDEPFNLLSIDPGTTTMGVGQLSWDLESKFIMVNQAFTLTANVKANEYASMAEVHGGRTARIQYLGDRLLQLLHDICPHAVIAESPYLGRFPQSYAALVECLTAIRLALHRYDPHMPLYLVDPTTAKQSAGVVLKKKGNNDKEDVRRALRSRIDLRWVVDIDELDEHSIDAIAVGYHYLKNMV